MFEEEKTRLYMNGVATGRFEILEQVKLILNNEEFPEYVEARMEELVQKYEHGFHICKEVKTNENND